MEQVIAPAKIANPIAVSAMDKFLAVAAALLLAATLIAVARGRADWAAIPVAVWPHLGTIILALALTPVMLLRRRGDRLHRRLGWLWVTSMMATALLSFNLRLINDGAFSLVHILSAWTIIQVPLIVWHARAHRAARHRSAVHGMVIGALLIAGFFTFPFDRLLGHWLFS